jgi:hypothetical protein
MSFSHGRIGQAGTSTAGGVGKSSDETLTVPLRPNPKPMTPVPTREDASGVASLPGVSRRAGRLSLRVSLFPLHGVAVEVVDDLLRGVGIGTGRNQTREVGEFVSRGNDRRLAFAVTELAEPHRRRQAVA